MSVLSRVLISFGKSTTMTKITNVPPGKGFNSLLTILLTILLGLNSCQEKCLCPDIDSIPFIEVKLYKYQGADLNGYFMPPPVPVDYPDMAYGYNYNTNIVDYCGQGDFEVTDSTAMVIGTGYDLQSSSDKTYYIDYGNPSEDSWNYIVIRGVSEDGVLYYSFWSYPGNFWETDGEGDSGTLSLGSEISYSAEIKETVALTEDDIRRISAEELIYNENGDILFTDPDTYELLVAPDSVVITTTYQFYINNIALVSKDDFVDGGHCAYM